MLKQISPELFTKELHQMDNSLLCGPTLKNLIDWGYIVGYCEASKLPGSCRNKDDYAVMFEIADNNEYMLKTYVEDRPNNRFWFHWPKATFDQILEMYKLQIYKEV